MEPLSPAAAPAVEAAATAVRDLSFLGLFVQADPVVKGVMVLLVLMSLGCWTLAFDRWTRIASARAQARSFATAVRDGTALTGLDGAIP